MISVVIPTWNGWHVLETCLESLRKQTFKDFEIIVVDNGSSDETKPMLQKRYPDVQTVFLEKNYGFSIAVNKGIKRSNGDMIVLLNNDTEPAVSWLEELVEAARKFNEFSIFASKVLIQSLPDRIDTAGDGFTIAGFGYKIGWLEKNNKQFNEFREVFGASACAALYRKEVFACIGYFDESFFAFAEDLDLSFRARLFGFRCLYVPKAIIYHRVRSTSPQNKTREWYYRNLIWLIYKNFPAPLLWLYAPHILMNWMLVGIRSILQGWFFIYLKSTLKGLSGLPQMRVKRKYIQRHKKISVHEIQQILTHNWIKIHWKLSRMMKNLSFF